MLSTLLISVILSLLPLFPLFPMQSPGAEQNAGQSCAAEEHFLAEHEACEEALLVSQEEADADDRSAVESCYLCISSPQGYLFSIEESNAAPVSQTHTEFSRRAPGVRPDFRFLHTYTILSTKFSGNLSYGRALHTLCLLRI